MRKDRGFTLLELAIGLIIIGLLTGAYFSAASIYVKQQRIENMTDRLNTVKAALSAFTKNNSSSHFPCPAPLTAAPGTAGFGQELCPADYNTVAAGDDLGGVFVAAGTGGNLVLIGAIPTTALKTSGDLMFDEYGNRFSYAVTMDLTQDDALLADPVATAAVERLYKEEQPDGSIVDRTTNVDFMIISHGADGAGSYSQQGAPNGNRCRVTEPLGLGDSRNCLWTTNFEAVFRDEAYNFASADTFDYFDDVVVHTLGEDKHGWWQASNGAGSNIVSKNPANIGIGPGITTPVQRLDVDGAIKIANTANTCTSATVGSIRYNNGNEDVVECCNGNATDGYAWSNIAYGCATGECNTANKGQMRYNTTIFSPEFCNGLTFVPAFGKNCNSDTYYNGEISEGTDVETTACDGGATGTMTRSRGSKVVCNNGTLETYPTSDYSDWDRSGCFYGNPPGYEVNRFGVASGCNNDWSSCYRSFSYPAPTCASGTAHGYACETHPGGCDNTDGTCCVVCD